VRGAGSVGSELAIALRGLAQDHEAPAAVPGAEIRRRAVRRRRRRGAALATAGTAGLGALALVLAVVLTGGEDTRTAPPAAGHGVRTPSPATAVPSPVTVAATVDLARRELTAGGRTLPVSAGVDKSPTPTGLMTVTAKYKVAMVPGTVAGWDQYEVKSAWVVRLRGPDDRTNYLLALGWDEKAPGSYDSTGGAIGMRTADAMWLYGVLSPGSVVEVVGPTEKQPTPTRPATRSATDTGTEEATPGAAPGAAALEDAATQVSSPGPTAAPGNGVGADTGADGGVGADDDPVPSR
jgi:lipoprotein-anchoring transpeptidase ErfK/SrfK